MENLYAAASGDLPVGWRGTGLDARQKALLLSKISSLFQPAPTANSAFRLGGQGGFGRFGGGASLNCREDEAILGHAQQGIAGEISLTERKTRGICCNQGIAGG